MIPDPEKEVRRKLFRHGDFSLRELKFTEGFVEELFGDSLCLPGSGLDEAGCGQVIDLSWDAACIIMDQGFHCRLKDFF